MSWQVIPTYDSKFLKSFKCFSWIHALALVHFLSSISIDICWRKLFEDSVFSILLISSRSSQTTSYTLGRTPLIKNWDNIPNFIFISIRETRRASKNFFYFIISCVRWRRNSTKFTHHLPPLLYNGHNCKGQEYFYF